MDSSGTVVRVAGSKILSEIMLIKVLGLNKTIPARQRNAPLGEISVFAMMEVNNH